MIANGIPTGVRKMASQPLRPRAWRRCSTSLTRRADVKTFALDHSEQRNAERVSTALPGQFVEVSSAPAMARSRSGSPRRYDREGRFDITVRKVGRVTAQLHPTPARRPDQHPRAPGQLLPVEDGARPRADLRGRRHRPAAASLPDPLHARPPEAVPEDHDPLWRAHAGRPRLQGRVEALAGRSAGRLPRHGGYRGCRVDGQGRPRHRALQGDPSPTTATRSPSSAAPRS